MIKPLLSIFIGFFLTISTFSLQAQTAPAVQWDKRFGGNSNEYLQSIIQTSDGGYLIGGTSFSGVSGDKTQASKGGFDYWIVKLDASGTKQWDKTFGGSADDFLLSATQTSDGGYLIGGNSDSGISGDKTQAGKGASDFWVLKLDATGTKVWDKSFGGSNTDALNSVAQTSDGGYILGGHSYSGISGDKTQASKGDSDFWIVKLNASGTKLWDKAFGGTGFDESRVIVQTSDGGYLSGGWSDSGTSADKTQASKGFEDFWVIKLNASGVKVWDKTFGGSGSENLLSLAQTSDGGYILGGDSDSGISGDKTQASKGDSDYWVVKLDANGTKQWDRSIGGSADDFLLSLTQTADGGYMLGGRSDSGISGDKTQPSRGDFDYWVVKTDAGGTKLWDKALGGASEDVLNSLSKTSDGGFILGGESKSGLSGDKTQASQGLFDYWIVKLAGTATGIPEPNSNLNLAVFPNPNQGKFRLQLMNLEEPVVEVTITDILSRIVIQQQFKVVGNYFSEELTTPLEKGIYMLRVKANNQNTTRKIVVE
jgi:hypothetical protein